MNVSRPEMLDLLSTEFEYWKTLVNPLTENEAVSARLKNGWSPKDLMAHLMAWNLLAVARLEAAHIEKKLNYPEWHALTPSGSELDVYNATIDELYKDKSWSEILDMWKQTFAKLIELGSTLADEKLTDTKRYAWTKGHMLFDELQGSYEHHRKDHLPSLLDWLETR